MNSELQQRATTSSGGKAVAAILAATAILVGLASASAPAGASSPGHLLSSTASWSVAHAPAPKSPGGNLVGVSCPQDNFCAAVGRYFDVNLEEGPFAEVFNGTTWSADELAVPPGSDGTYLTAVSCTSSTFCVAVGSYDSKASPELGFAEVWNGTRWAFHSTAQPAGSEGTVLNGVSCFAPTACYAVGTYLASAGDLSLAETWNGSTWKLAATPNPAQGKDITLNSVSCPATTTCMAVGSYLATSGDAVSLAEYWDGAKWSIQTTADPFDSPTSVLNSVSCSDTTDCTATGQYCTAATALQCVELAADQTLVEVWDGTAWALQSSSDPSTEAMLNAVACTSTTGCVGVGQYEPNTKALLNLAEVWNGATWTTTPSPSASTTSNQLSSVSCASATDCIAVGYSWDSTSIPEPTALAWDGTSWNTVSIPSPLTATHSLLKAVSCSAASVCMSVGYERTVTGLQLGVAEYSKATAWTIAATPVPAGSFANVLNGVSCPSSTDCVAVGYIETGAAKYQALSEIWNGTTWTTSSPVDPSASLNQLNSISCVSATDCVAVGYSETGGSYVPLAETWNGTAWSLTSAPNPKGGYYTILNAVACTSGQSCTAVGSYKLRSSKPAPPLAEGWNGTAWTIESTVNPTGPGQTTFNSVACTSTNSCIAVGSTLDASVNTIPLSETLVGGTWALQPTPNPTGATESFLNGVSCVGSQGCTAIGSTGSLLSSSSLAEVWSGSAWTQQEIPNPAGSDQTNLYGISCSDSTHCSAVGDQGSLDADTQSPLAEVES